MSQRLLIAIADPELSSAVAALAAEGDDLEVVDRVSDPEELARTLRRHGRRRRRAPRRARRGAR